MQEICHIWGKQFFSDMVYYPEVWISSQSLLNVLSYDVRDNRLGKSQ